jgi:hypothetical protein
VWREAGPDAYRRLVGTILAPPVWEVRYAKFDGDVVERAEEWRVAITNDRRMRAFSHAVPETRAGPRLSREAALPLASRALATSFEVDADKLTLVAADEEQRPARTDWSFVFGDPRIVVGAGGEARYAVTVAGEAVAGMGRFVHVPETWTRAERERNHRLEILGLVAVILFFAAGLAALVVGILGFVRHRVDTKLLRIVFAATFVIAVLSSVNAWPSVAMGLTTAEPVATQVATKAIGGYPCVGTPDRVAEELANISRAGMRGIAVSFVNYLNETPYFCDEVVPRLARLGIRQPH